ncbi:Uncharacterized protein dnl_37800 [Desulfonema limicola]|uniref:Uncharacterized protein n=1 Tax=Desulfonema limicola TaxID=45656 RepID=A0A975B9W2_9BACT|nr:hypothetical protein [Desulfonema limicola]QTA81445.1 Uncharacterized protein dnl_37800 [Desulfonema limicola]
MNIQSAEITIPNVRLNLNQLLTIIRHLDKPARIEVARVLTETGMDAELNELIYQLEAMPDKNISNDDIAKEIRAVRQSG